MEPEIRTELGVIYEVKEGVFAVRTTHRRIKWRVLKMKEAWIFQEGTGEWTLFFHASVLPLVGKLIEAEYA